MTLQIKNNWCWVEARAPYIVAVDVVLLTLPMLLHLCITIDNGVQFQGVALSTLVSTARRVIARRP